MFVVDDTLKKHIVNTKKKKPKWKKLKYIDLALLVVSIYCACFSVFYSIINPSFTYFYGSYGNITTSGRILTMFIRTSIVYLMMSIPYFIVHFYYLKIVGIDILNRIKEEINVEDNILTYSYKELSKPNTNITVLFDRTKIEKIVYSDDTNKMIIYGDIFHTLKNKEIEQEKNINDFVMYGYFKPDLLRWFEEKNVKIEYMFCFDNK